MDFSFGFGLGSSAYLLSGYNPLINYDWSTTTAQEYKTDGVELITNGTFDTDISGWSVLSPATMTRTTEGYLSIARGSGAFTNQPTQQISVVAGNTYRATCNVISSPTAFFTEITTLSLDRGKIIYAGIGSRISKGLLVFKFTATTTEDILLLVGVSGIALGVSVVDNISVQKVIEEPNKRYLKDVGSTPTYNASMYFGRGAYFNGVDQSVNTSIMPDFRYGGTVIVKAVYSYNNGVNRAIIGCNDGSNRIYIAFLGASYLIGVGNVFSNNVPINLIEGKSYTFRLEYNGVNLCSFYVDNNLVLSFSTSITAPTTIPISIGNRYLESFYYAGVIKDAYIFTRLLTTTEKDSYTNTPEAFYAMAQDDSTCVLNMPMCETSSTVRNYKTGIDYPITNYTSSVRDNAKNLQYGLQACKFVRDSVGVIQSASDYLECDGTGYAIIPSHTDTVNIKMTVNPTSLSGNLLSGGVTKTLTGLTLNVDNDVVISNVTPIGAITLASGFSGTIKSYKEELV